MFKFDFFMIELSSFLSIVDISRLLVVSKEFNQHWQLKWAETLTRPNLFKKLVENEKFKQIELIYEHKLESMINPNYIIHDEDRKDKSHLWPGFWNCNFPFGSGPPEARYFWYTHENFPWLMKNRVDYSLFCASVKRRQLFKHILNDKRTNLSANDFDSFQLACWFGYFEEVSEFLEKDKQLNLNLNVSSNSNFALRWACLNGRKEIIDLILKHKSFDFDSMETQELQSCSSKFQRSEQYDSLFLWLLRYGQFEVIQNLWEKESSKYDSSQIFDNAFASLHKPVESAVVLDEMIEFILKRIPKPIEAFQFAVSNFSAKWVKKLIEDHGVDLSPESKLCVRFLSNETQDSELEQKRMQTLNALLQYDEFDFTVQNYSLIWEVASRSPHSIPIFVSFPKVRKYIARHEFLLELARGMWTNEQAFGVLLRSTPEIDLTVNEHEIVMNASTHNAGVIRAIARNSRSVLFPIKEKVISNMEERCRFMMTGWQEWREITNDVKRILGID